MNWRQLFLSSAKGALAAALGTVRRLQMSKLVAACDSLCPSGDPDSLR